jgi:putative CocE/NonD family hydrolase
LLQWPPNGVENTSFYLNNAGGLSASATKGGSAYKEYVSDPANPVPFKNGTIKDRGVEYMDGDQRFAAKRADVLSFETESLGHDVTVAGPLSADLWVSLATTDADFVVKLIDVFPDDFKYSDTDKYPMGGYQMLVRGDVMRGRYRNSLSRPRAFLPGKPTEVKYTLNDIAHTFKKGHRIMVQVQSSWFPLVDRNPQQLVDIYHAKNSDFIKSKIRVYLSGENASRIILPVMKQ